MSQFHRLLLPILLLASSQAALLAEPTEFDQAAVGRGYRLLLDKAYVPHYFDGETFEDCWRAWPQETRQVVEDASPTARRAMAFQRYGLTARPHNAFSVSADEGKPLQFVIRENGQWVPNCFGCHGGNLLGKPYPGLPNVDYALQTMIQETRLTKIRLGRQLTPIDFGALVMPLGTTVGTTNAVIFGVALAGERDPDLNYRPRTEAPRFVHHDMDAPPWWHFSKKKRLYLDGFAVKGHRPLMQFALDRVNGPERFAEWEEDYRDIYAYLESIEAPPYPFEIDRQLANQGEQVFNRVCSECHGTYGVEETYPHRIVDIDEIGTDRARHESLTKQHRAGYASNWFSHYGQDEVILEPGGYMAPPLDGIWASAPYFHNGSVPTLWHVLHPDRRPAVWRRVSAEYDQDRVGFGIEAFSEQPNVREVTERRRYFNTSRFGKSNRGHRYPDLLEVDEKRAVLEYLKTI